MQVAISLLRVLLFVARPRTFILGNLPNSNVYRNVEQYQKASSVPGVLILEIDAPIYFANSNYLRERYAYAYSNTYNTNEFTNGLYKDRFDTHLDLPLLVYRITRWIDDEEDRIKSSGETTLQYVILDMTGECFETICGFPFPFWKRN